MIELNVGLWLVPFLTRALDPGTVAGIRQGYVQLTDPLPFVVYTRLSTQFTSTAAGLTYPVVPTVRVNVWDTDGDRALSVLSAIAEAVKDGATRNDHGLGISVQRVLVVNSGDAVFESRDGSESALLGPYLDLQISYGKKG